MFFIVHRDPRALFRSRKAIHVDMSDEDLIANVTNVCKLQVCYNMLLGNYREKTSFLLFSQNFADMLFKYFSFEFQEYLSEKTSY